VCKDEAESCKCVQQGLRKEGVELSRVGGWRGGRRSLEDPPRLSPLTPPRAYCITVDMLTR
jgi:hypothetical protein